MASVQGYTNHVRYSFIRIQVVAWDMYEPHCSRRARILHSDVRQVCSHLLSPDGGQVKLIISFSSKSDAES